MIGKKELSFWWLQSHGSLECQCPWLPGLAKNCSCVGCALQHERVLSVYTCLYVSVCPLSVCPVPYHLYSPAPAGRWQNVATTPALQLQKDDRLVVQPLACSCLSSVAGEWSLRTCPCGSRLGGECKNLVTARSLALSLSSVSAVLCLSNWNC